MSNWITKNKWNIAFWSTQLFGWGGLHLFSYVVTPDIDGYTETKFYAFALWASFFIGLVSTGLLRTYLKRNIFLEKFTSKEALKIALSVTITAIFYAVVSYSTGYLKGTFDTEEVTTPKFYENFGIEILIFNSFVTILAWTVIYYAVKMVFKFNRDRVERSQLDASLRQAQLNTLKGQINPHFMFNSLNNIRGLMLEDVERSREMLTKLSEMLRYSLTKNDLNAIAVEEELEMVDNYIDLSRIQFEDRLVYEKNIAKEVLTAPIPPMIIQLLVENGVKHGIANLKEGGKITLDIENIENELSIRVRNTGKLRIAQESTQLGLKNIRQRLGLLYGKKATFSLKEESNEVLADIKIPLTS